MLKTKPKTKTQPADPVIAGFIVGLLFGLAAGDLGLGISAGLLTGYAYRAIRESYQNQPGAKRSFMLAVAALGIVIALWITDIVGCSETIIQNIVGAGLVMVLGLGMLNTSQ